MTTLSLKDAARQFHGWGANINAIREGSKGPINTWKPLCSRRQSAGEVKRLPWGEAAGVGVINGPGGWRTVDIDAKKRDEHGTLLPPGQIVPVPESILHAVLQALGLPADYRWAWRSGSGTGWEIAFICHDELPEGVLSAKEQEPGVFWGTAKDGDAFDHLELRWEHCQTIYPPSAYEKPGAPGYQWRGETPDAPPAIVSVGHVLAAFFAVAKLKRAEVKPEPKPKRETARMQSSTVADAIAEVKQRFDLVAYARAHWPGELQRQRNGEIRICGHGGLMIDEDAGVWHCFGWEAGGDAIELVGRKLYGNSWKNDDGAKFWAALEEAARETNVTLPPKPQGNAGRFNVSQVEPVTGGDDVVTLRRADYEQLRRSAEQADKLEGWREWAMKVAQIETKKLSPAAKVVAFTLWPEMQFRQEQGVDEPKRVYIEEASKRAGLSAGTYGAKLKELDTVGAIGRIPDRQPNGHKKILMEPRAFFDPTAWEPPAPRDHGGYHPKKERPIEECPTGCSPETSFREEVATIARLVCTGCEEELLVTPERLTHRTWAIDPETGIWGATRFLPTPPEANTQIAGYREDGSTSTYEASPTLAGEPDANTQIAGGLPSTSGIADKKYSPPARSQIEIIGPTASVVSPIDDWQALQVIQANDAEARGDLKRANFIRQAAGLAVTS